MPNSNWPTLFAEGEFGSNPYYAPPAALVYTDLTPRLYGAWSTRRGKQFELDQMQPGEFNGQWRNQDGALDPTNATSPYSPGILPYRGYRIRAQYPPSINLLNADVATGGDATPLAPGATLSGVTSAYGTPAVTASASAWQGAQVWQVPVAGAASVGLTLLGVTYPAVQAVPGTPYTMTFHVRSATTGANPVLTPIINWVGISGTISVTSGSTVPLTGSPTATWTAVTLSGTVPAGGIAAGLGFTLTTAPTPAWNFQADGIQWEQNATASTFAAPGVNYPVFSGLAERYPQSWTSQGTYGLVTPVGVDALALLSQTTLGEAFIMDVLATAPQWFFPLNDSSSSSGAPAFQEHSGLTPPGSVFSAAAGAGTLTPGSSITAATLPGGKFYGTNGPVATVNNPTQNQGTVIDLTTAGITSPPTSGAWTRMIAFRCGQTTFTPVFAAYSPGLNPGTAGYSGNMYWGLQSLGGSAMGPFVTVYNAAGQSLGVASIVVANDSNWHLAFVQMSADGKTVTITVDGFSTSSTGANDMHSSLVANESIGGDMYKMDGSVGAGGTNFIGDVALYAQWNSLLTGAQMTALTFSFRFAGIGDSTDARYARILGWAGFRGAQSLDAGNTTALTYANDIAGLDALTALNNVVATEGGRHFIGADGAANFQNRQRFFQATTPAWTFGENQAGGEIPYSALAFDFDPTRISNSVAVTAEATSLVYSAADAASQQNYGTRNLARTNQSLDPEEVRESAFFYLSRYKDPHLRVQALRIDAASNPSLWPSVLAFELGQYIKIIRRDQFGVRPTITMFGFIEQITHTGSDTGAWQVDLQVSPAAGTAYATFTSLRTTLFSSATGGASTITISALPDAATNPVRSELTDNQRLLISGGGNSETAFIAAGGVQDQNAGYTSAVITLASPLGHNYPSGASVVENIGANYDALAAFDAVQFSY